MTTQKSFNNGKAKSIDEKSHVSKPKGTTLTLALGRPCVVGAEEKPIGTVIAKVTLLEDATINLLVDGFKSGVVKEVIG